MLGAINGNETGILTPTSDGTMATGSDGKKEVQVVQGRQVAECMNRQLNKSASTVSGDWRSATSNGGAGRLQFEMSFLITFTVGTAFAVLFWLPISRVMLRWANARIGRLK